jgi:thioredoxin-like negative regulator of GroEL
MAASPTVRAPTAPAARPALVVFQSKTCGRCRRAEGYLAQVLQRRQNHDTFSVYRVDADERPDLVERFHVSRLPTFAVVEGKRVRARLERPGGCTEINELLAPWLH